MINQQSEVTKLAYDLKIKRKTSINDSKFWIIRKKKSEKGRKKKLTSHESDTTTARYSVQLTIIGFYISIGKTTTTTTRKNKTK